MLKRQTYRTISIFAKIYTETLKLSTHSHRCLFGGKKIPVVRLNLKNNSPCQSADALVTLIGHTRSLSLSLSLSLYFHWQTVWIQIWPEYINTAWHIFQPAHKVGLPSALQRNTIQMAVRLRAGGGPLWIKLMPGITGCMLNGYVSRLKPQRGKRPFCIKANFLRQFASISRPSCLTLWFIYY